MAGGEPVSGGFDLSNYVDVAERIEKFREKHPDGSLQTELVELPEAFASSFIAVKAYAFRSPDDPRPGVDYAWELVPGKTPYTKDSELMNACTSAVGRAIVAALAADTKRGIASKEEVAPRNAPQGPADDLKRRAVEELTRAGQPTTRQNIEKEMQRLSESGATSARENPAGSDGEGDHLSDSSPQPEAPSPLPPANGEAALAARACDRCGRTNTKRVPVGDKVLCRDASGCKKRAEEQAAA
jgi:hypothetical protein